MSMASAFRRLRERMAPAVAPEPGNSFALNVHRSPGMNEDLVYARGFLLADGIQPSVPAAWRKMPAGERTLHVDPRVPVDHAVAGRRQLWLLGDAFDPVAGVYQDVAEHLLGGDLFERLDQLAGRFVLFVQDGPELAVYHDAMGSRSVFYATNGVVASHAALVAEVVGAGFREWILPFITSEGFRSRDVKFLPGLHSPFEGIEQLTPNTRLVLPGQRVERYWPREELKSSDPRQAFGTLMQHVQGLRTYLEANRLWPVVGLSGGRDSRVLLASLASLQPHVFTYVRSTGGKSESSADSRIAKELAKSCGLDLNVVKIAAPPPLDETATAFAAEFRRNTGYVRTGNSRWVECLHGRGDLHGGLFVRGFGGEVLRGFYRPFSETTPGRLAGAYSINAGSSYTLDAFAHFIETAGWTDEALWGYSPADLLYWEYRMGIWGSSSMVESDMAFRSMPGYNSRVLFMAFMGLPAEIRAGSALFEEATASLLPELAGVPYDS